MRKFYITLVILLLVQTTIFSQTSPIAFGLPTTKFCPGQIFPISFTNDPSLDGHTFQVQLSNLSGSFTSGISVLGSGTSSPISCTMISALTNPSTLRKVRIIDITSPTNISSTSDVISNVFLSSSMNRYPVDTLGNSNFSSTLCTGSSLKLFTNMESHDGYGATYSWKNTSNPSVELGIQNKYIVNQAGNYSVTVNKTGCNSGTSLLTQINYSSTISPFLPFPGEVHCAGIIIPIKPTYHSETVTYEWTKDGIVVANTGKYDVASSGSYSVKITDNTCQSTKTVNFTLGNNVPIQFDAINDTIEICSGATSTITINASFISGNTIEWFRDGQSVSPNNSYLTSLNTSIAGIYTVKLKEGNCTTFSNPVVVKSVTSFSKPVFILDKENTTCVINPSLTTYALQGLNLGQVQWIKDGVNIAGATSNIYSPSSTGSYSLKVSQGSCQGISNSVNFTSVADNPPYIIEAIPNLCSASFRLSLQYSRSSFSFVQYQWFRDGTAISGATSVTYNALLSGAYKVRISMSISSCVGFSQDLIVTISSNMGKPTIILRKDNAGISKNFQCQNNLGKIFISDVNINYNNTQWKKDGVNIPNPSGKTNYFNVTQSGDYSVSYTSGTCTVESNSIKINIGDKQQSIKSNNWDNPTSWACGTVPIVTDEVIINKGHIISLPDNYTGFLKNLELNGILQKENNAQLKFQTN